MPRQSKLYIDPTGVKRGYYVYLHRETGTNRVFYVGKGHGNRAWEKTGRNPGWREKVASLDDAWEVVIAAGDLTEIEAFELEEELVQEHGGPASSGGKLTNWIPGGEHLAATLSLDLGPEIAAGIEAYNDERKFKELSRREQEKLAKLLKSELSPIQKKLEALEEEADDLGDDVLSEIASDFEVIIGSHLALTSDFLRRRVTWKDFAMSVEEMLEDLDSEDIEDAIKLNHLQLTNRAPEIQPDQLQGNLDNLAMKFQEKLYLLEPSEIEELNQRVQQRIQPLVESAEVAAKKIFDAIDSGN